MNIGTIDLVQGDLSLVILLTVTQMDALEGKTLRFQMFHPAGTGSCLDLPATLVGDKIQVPLTEQATAQPGVFLGQVYIVGEQTTFETVTVNIRPRCA